MFQITAGILLILFYLIYYGKLFLQKRRGIQTYQLDQQKQGTEKAVGMLMGIATLLVPIGDVIAIWQNRSLTPDWLRWIGAAVGSTGILLFFLSVTTMGDSWRAGVSAGEKTSLVTRGVYSISRNPAFLAFDLAYLGLLLMFFRWWLLALSLFAMVMLHLQIVLVEEPFLPKVFGADYEAYRSRVCRYLGRRRA